MTLQDFSQYFDSLCNSYITSGKFGDTMPDIRFDEYEKSQFLTKAQEEYVISLYNGKNPYGESFEQTEELRRYLASLIKECTCNPITNSGGMPLSSNDKHAFFTLPQDLWFITYEAACISNPDECNDGAYMDVYPVRQDEYNKVKRNPFRGANKRRALRLDLSEGTIEVISKYAITSYYVRYIKKIKPIILVDLAGDGMDINNESQAMGCELHESLHQRILELAVRMALQSKGYSLNRDK